MRLPKGTIIQPLPSWNMRRMAGSGGGLSPVPQFSIVAVGLQNNSQAGEWLVVWDVQVYANPAGDISHINIINFSIMNGQTGHSQGTEPNNPLASGVGALPGFVWIDEPSFNPGKIFSTPALPAQGYQWPHDWPIAAIAPGDSLVVFSDAQPTNTFGVNYLYEVVLGGI